MKYEQRVRISEDLIAAIQQMGDLISEQDNRLLRQVRRYRDSMAAATSEREAQIAVSNLGRYWVDSGDWDSAFANEVELLLTSANKKT